MKFHITDQSKLIDVVLPHFDNYPLVTSKRLNFIDFKTALLNNNGPSKDLSFISNLKEGIGRSFADKFNSLSITTLQPQWVRVMVKDYYMYI